MKTRPATSSQPSREQLLSLAHDLPAVWNAPQADMALKQRLCRLLIQEIVCDIDRDCDEVVLVVHWHGGRHSELRFPKNVTGQTRRCTPAAAQQLLSTLGGKIPEKDLASLLNDRGLRTGADQPWTAGNVRAYLYHHGITTFHGSQKRHRSGGTSPSSESLLVDQGGA